MRKITLVVSAVAIALMPLFWVGGKVFGCCGSFQKPGIPLGANVKGPAAKGTITYIVGQPGGIVQPSATIQFQGQCTIGDGSNAVTHQVATTAPGLDVTQITVYSGVAAATAQTLSDAVDNFFNPDSTVVHSLLQTCWPGAFGVFVQSVNGQGTKTTVPGSSPPIFIWTGDATLKGVFH